MSAYPEHDKLALIKDKSQAIGHFLDVMPYHLCEYVEIISRHTDEPIGEELQPVMKPISTILARHFGINESRLALEKHAMLAEIRSLNKPAVRVPVTRTVDWGVAP